jgi:inorganic triphosphatase YgiF
VRSTASEEVELKLELGESDVARLAHHPWLTEISEGRPLTRALRSVYFDTPDLALWRRGLVLRVREVGRHRMVGVKTRGSARGGLVAREEVEAALASDVPELRRLPRALLLGAIPDARLYGAIERAAAGKRLAPRVETRVRRTTRRLRHGTALIELALDVGEVRAGRRSLPIRELELERISGSTRALYDVALRLSSDVVLRPGVLGKAERGFARLSGLEASPSRAERPPLARGASLEAALRAVFGECLRHMTANQPAAERGADPEGVHQMRVGVRRFRSALRLFRSELPMRTAQALTRELRWLAGVLGEARDLDVFLAELLAPLTRTRPGDRGLAVLREAAEAARAEAYSVLRRELASQRYAILVLRLGRFVEGEEWHRRGAPALMRPARPVARRLLRHRAARLQQLGERVAELSAQDLHRLRIRAKRLRYAAELLGPIFGDKAPARAARRLAELQDVLGHLNDQATAEKLVVRLHGRLPEISSEVMRAEGFAMGYAASSAAAGHEALARAWRRVEQPEPFWK